MENPTIEAAAHADCVLIMDRKPLLQALQMLARRVVERRNTIPILENVRFTPSGDGGVDVHGTDLDMGMTFTLPGAWEAPFEFTAPAAMLADIVKAADGDTIMLQLQDRDRVLVTSGRMRQTVNALPVDDYPSTAVAKPLAATAPIVLPGRQLAADLARVALAISTEETRYYLNGVFVHVRDGNLIMVATDGHRLSRIIRPAPDGLVFEDAIIPRKAIAVLQALMKAEPDADVTLEPMTCVRWGIRIGNVHLVTKTIDGTFPDYNRVIPCSDATTTLVIPAGELARIAGTIPKTGEGKGRTLAVDLIPGQDSARAGTPVITDKKTGNVLDKGSVIPGGIRCDVFGDAHAIGWNPRYLESFAKIATGTLRFELLPEDNAPARITDGAEPAWLGILMPVRCDGLPAAEAPQMTLYPPVTAAPGQAASLWGVERMSDTLAMGDGPRSATANEAATYLVDYARRCGFRTDCIGEGTGLQFAGDVARCLIVGQRLAEATVERREIIDWNRIGVVEFEDVRVPEQWAEGSLCVVMPGYRDIPVTAETADETGVYGAPAVVRLDAKRNVTLDKSTVQSMTGLEPVKPVKAKAVRPPSKRALAKAAREAEQAERQAAAARVQSEAAAEAGAIASVEACAMILRGAFDNFGDMDVPETIEEPDALPDVEEPESLVTPAPAPSSAHFDVEAALQAMAERIAVLEAAAARPDPVPVPQPVPAPSRADNRHVERLEAHVAALQTELEAARRALDEERSARGRAETALAGERQAHAATRTKALRILSNARRRRTVAVIAGKAAAADARMLRQAAAWDRIIKAGEAGSAPPQPVPAIIMSAR